MVFLCQSEWRTRLDLTDQAVFSIDPEGAKDVDDALHVQQLTSGVFEVIYCKAPLHSTENMEKFDKYEIFFVRCVSLYFRVGSCPFVYEYP